MVCMVVANGLRRIDGFAADKKVTSPHTASISKIFCSELTARLAFTSTSKNSLPWRHPRSIFDHYDSFEHNLEIYFLKPP